VTKYFANYEKIPYIR